MNNIEIVGIPPAETPGAAIEDTLIEIFNSLPELTNKVSPNDIDISHIMPSDRKDRKLIAVCRFKSRKTKFDILEAKKKSRNFKFKNQDIFISDHLSPFNRHLFANAVVKKRELNYKFLWSRNGAIFLRENEHSPVFKIETEDNLNDLTRSVDSDNGSVHSMSK